MAAMMFLSEKKIPDSIKSSGPSFVKDSVNIHSFIANKTHHNVCKIRRFITNAKHKQGTNIAKQYSSCDVELCLF